MIITVNMVIQILLDFSPCIKLFHFLKKKILTTGTARSEDINRFDNSILNWVFFMTRQVLNKKRSWSLRNLPFLGSGGRREEGKCRSCGKQPKLLKKISDSTCAWKEMGLCVRLRVCMCICVGMGGHGDSSEVVLEKVRTTLGWQCELRLEESIIQGLTGPDNLHKDPEARNSSKSS